MPYTFADVKSVIYDYNYCHFPYLRLFWKNPYTFLKAQYYMFFSSCLVYFLARTSIRPNHISYLYIISGFLGGLLLSLPSFIFNCLGVFVFFNKGILDWSDGSLARLKYAPSTKGHILDEYGARVNSVCFSIGVGFFCYHNTLSLLYLYLIPLFPLFHGQKLSIFAKAVILDNINTSSQASSKFFTVNQANKSSIFKNPLFSWSKTLFDDSAKYVDLILLFVLLDMYYHTYFSSIFFFILLFRFVCDYIFSFLHTASVLSYPFSSR